MEKKIAKGKETRLCIVQTKNLVYVYWMNRKEEKKIEKEENGTKKKYKKKKKKEDDVVREKC